jgi:hypothetical protein
MARIHIVAKQRELLNPYFETNPTFREKIGHRIHKLTTSPLEEMNIDLHEYIEMMIAFVQFYLHI